MFEIGEKIFYPMHGAGIVEAIETKEINDKKILYYRMNLPLKNMNVMIPVEKVEDFKIRRVVEPNILDQAKSIFQQKEKEVCPSGQLRTKENMEKLKTGDILEEAEVICDLIRLRKKRKLVNKNLTMTDKSMLENACRNFISELALVKDVSQEQASYLFHHVVNTMK